jgi:hypothetical protein
MNSEDENWVQGNLEQREGGNPDVFEEVGIAGPRLLLLDAALRRFVVLEDGIRVRAPCGRVRGDDVVLDLPCLASYRRRGRRRLHLFLRPRPIPLRPSLLTLPLTPTLTSLPPTLSSHHITSPLPTTILEPQQTLTY